MIRYCTKCQKEFDITIKSMDELENLQCPYCHEKVDKNSRTPQNKAENEWAEGFVGKLYHTFLRLRFYLYPVLGGIGLATFFLHAYVLLYVLTLITLLVFLSQFGLGSRRMLWPIAGAMCGYYVFRSPEGVCAGIMASWLVRYVVRTIWFEIIVKLIRIGQ